MPVVDYPFRPERYLRRAYKACGSWRALSEFIGFGSPALWRAAAKGHISRDVENRLRRRLRLMPRRCRTVDDMKTDDLRWYLQTRC